MEIKRPKPLGEWYFWSTKADVEKVMHLFHSFMALTFSAALTPPPSPPTRLIRKRVPASTLSGPLVGAPHSPAPGRRLQSELGPSWMSFVCRSDLVRSGGNSGTISLRVKKQKKTTTKEWESIAGEPTGRFMGTKVISWKGRRHGSSEVGKARRYKVRKKKTKKKTCSVQEEWCRSFRGTEGQGVQVFLCVFWMLEGFFFFKWKRLFGTKWQPGTAERSKAYPGHRAWSALNKTY